MSKLCRIEVGDQTFAATAGDRILDAALRAGIELPHDCRSGQCGTCLVRVLDGHVLGGDCGLPGSVRACQAVVLSDLRLAEEDMPAVEEHAGVVAALSPLSRDVVEVTVATRDPFHWLPGQYVNVRFERFPERAFSPTVALDGRDRPGTFRLHVKRLAGGRVSAELGHGIRRGHRLSFTGPCGSAFLRRGERSRLVLFAGGTGFAPIWAIADAALREATGRRLVVAVGVGSIHGFYMASALERLVRCPNVAIYPLVAEPQTLVPHVAAGRLSDLAHLIEPADTVHAAGPPAMVEALARRAADAGATFHADPFTPGADERPGWLARAKGRLAEPPSTRLARPEGMRLQAGARGQ